MSKNTASTSKKASNAKNCHTHAESSSAKSSNKNSYSESKNNARNYAGDIQSEQDCFRDEYDKNCGK